MEPRDLVIVGGGPVGLATAIQAVRRGLSVVVLEKRRPPLDKACGEGLMPPGVAALREMGVELPVSGCAPFVGIRYVDGSTVATGHFAEGEGLGIRRTVLAGAMAERAGVLGVELRHGCAVRAWRRISRGGVCVETDAGEVEGRLLVGADGLHSRTRRDVGLDRGAVGRRRFGVRRHYGVAPWSRYVEVHWSGAAEAYVTPVGSEEVGVAILRDREGDDICLSRFPALAERLRGAEPVSVARGAGPFRQRVRRRYAAGVVLVGDAAGYIDALTGEGLALGFLGARALVDCVAEGRPLKEYEIACRRLGRNHVVMTKLLLALAARPRLRARVVRMLARRPALFDRMLAVNAGQHSLGSLFRRPGARSRVKLARR